MSLLGPLRVVPVQWCADCGQAMPADHVRHLPWPDFTYGMPGDLPDNPLT